MNVLFLKQIQKNWHHPANKNDQFQAIKRSVRWWLNNRKDLNPTEVDFCGYKLLLYPDSFQTRSIVY